jgi:hypothetical protein
MSNLKTVPTSKSIGRDPDVMRAALGLNFLFSSSNQSSVKQPSLDPNLRVVTPINAARTMSMLPSAGVSIPKTIIKDCIQRSAHIMNAFKLQHNVQRLPNGKYNEILSSVKQQYGIPWDFNIPRRTITRYSTRYLDSDPLILSPNFTNTPSFCGNNPSAAVDEKYNVSVHLEETKFMWALPETTDGITVGDTVFDMLEYCQNKLSNISDFIVTTPMKENLVDLYKFMRTTVDTKGEMGYANGDAPILYCCGSTGVGKSLAVNCLSEIALKQTIDIPTAEFDRVKFINCSTMDRLPHRFSFQDFLQKYDIDELVIRDGADGSNRRLDGTFILVLDEVDFLIGNKTGERLLKTILDIASKPSSLLGVIGISNNVHNKTTQQLIKLGIGRNKVVFPTYLKEELVDIIRCQIGFTIIDKKTIQFMAAKHAYSGGDARKFLDHVNMMIHYTTLRLSEDNHDILYSSEKDVRHVTTLRDAMKVFTEASPNLKDTILDLPAYQRQTICIAAAISRKLNGQELTVSFLFQLLSACLGYEVGQDSFDMSDYKKIVESLSDTGLIVIKEPSPVHDSKRRKKKTSYIPAYQPLSGTRFLSATVTIQYPLEDIESAIEKVIVAEPYYGHLLKRFDLIVNRMKPIY